MNNHNKDGLINLFISYSGVLLAFVITILKARTLTTEEIGLISIIVTISFIASLCSNMGFHFIIKKYYFFYEKEKAKQNTLIFMVFLITIVNIGIVFILLTWKREFILGKFNNELLNLFYNYVYIIVLFEAINQIFMSVYQIKGKSVTSNLIYDFFFKSVSLILLLVYKIFNVTFSVYLVSYIFLYVFRTVLFILFVTEKKEIFNWDFSIVSKSRIKIAVRYSLLMFFSSFAYMLTKTIDKLMLGSMVDLDVVGIYTIILTFPILIQSIGSAFGLTGHAKVSEFLYRDDRKELQKLYNDNVDILVFLGLFVFGIFLVFGKPILYFFNENLVLAYWATIFLMFGELVSITTGLGGWIISFSQDYIYESITRVFLIAFTIITNYIFIPLFGLTGAALATSISLIAYSFAKIVILNVRIKIFPFTFEIIKIMLLFLIFFSFTFFVQFNFNFKNIYIIITFSLFLFVLYLIVGKYLIKLKILKEIRQIFR